MLRDRSQQCEHKAEIAGQSQRIHLGTKRKKDIGSHMLLFLDPLFSLEE